MVATTCVMIVHLSTRVKNVNKHSVVMKVLVIAKRAIRRFAGIVLLFATAMALCLVGMLLALDNTALIAPMKFSLNSLAHVPNATKSHATLAEIWNQIVLVGSGALGVSEHLATPGKRRRRS